MNLKINHIIDAIISEEQQKSIIINYINESLKWKQSFFIKDNKVYESITYQGSHSWSEDKFVRESSREDVIIYDFYNLIKKQNL